MAKKPYTEREMYLVNTFKRLQQAQNAEKYASTKNVSKSKQRAQLVAEDKAIGIETRKSSPAKKIKGASRGGRLNKKTRE